MKRDDMPPVMILCGGKGTRLRDVTEILPKPMVPIGEQPIVWHIMKSYAAFGVRRFILCLGYKREAFVDYFMNYHLRTSDATITLGHEPSLVFHGDSREADWQVTLAGTGLETMTGVTGSASNTAVSTPIASLLMENSSVPEARRPSSSYHPSKRKPIFA